MPPSSPGPSSQQSLIERLGAPFAGLRHLLGRFVRRRILLHRRPLGALAAVGAVLAGYTAVTTPPPPGTPVWVASHAVAGGTVLRADDLHRVRFKPSTAPERRIRDPDQVVGRTLAAGLSTGQPVTTDAVVGRPMLRDRPDLSAVPVRITDPAVVSLLRVGDEVQLIATDTESGVVRTTTPASVLAIPSARTSGPSGVLPGRLVVVGVPVSAARNVANASARCFVTVMWSG